MGAGVPLMPLGGMPRGIKPPAGYRWCSECKQFRSEREFGAYPNALCLPHYREYDRAKQKRLTKQSPGRRNAAATAWAKANPERVKEHQRRHGKKLVASGKNAEKHRARFAKDPEKMRAYWRKAYRRKYAANPLYFYYRTLNRRALRKNAPGTCTRKDVEAVLQEFNRRCVYCGAEATSVDHIVPLNEGGTNFLWNIAPSCRSCNSQKSAMDPLAFIRGRRMTRKAIRRVRAAVEQHHQTEQR